jgi:CheY-like chemotaxis protein
MNQQSILSPRKPRPQQGRRDEETARRLAGRMVLCLGDQSNSAVIERYFQERGWRVHLANSGLEARALVREMDASVALLAEEIPADESGWLTCWKLLQEAPKTKVIVIGASHVERGATRAEFIGATAYLRATEPAASIYRTLHAPEGSVI